MRRNLIQKSEPWRDALYDHYKDTFFHQREREKLRDRQFLVVVALFAALGVTASCASAITAALAAVSVAGVKLNLSGIPVSAVLTAGWTAVFVISLRYCTNSINIERQYDYIHSLEEKLSWAAGRPNLFSREGRAYLDKYPAVSQWAYIVYVYLLPLVVVVASTSIATYEWLAVYAVIGFKVADSVFAVLTCSTFILYRVVPFITMRRTKRAI